MALIENNLVRNSLFNKVSKAESRLVAREDRKRSGSGKVGIACQTVLILGYLFDGNVLQLLNGSNKQF